MVTVYAKDCKTIMLNRLKSILIPLSAILIVFLPTVGLFLQRKYIVFSDAAKFADVARNLVKVGVYGILFSFGGGRPYAVAGKAFFSTNGILPVMPFSIAAFFKIFCVTDFAVIATSFFYFSLTLVFVFLLSKKIFKSNLVGVLSTLAIGFNYDLINYATSGASESPFIFEIVAAVYFVSLRKKWGTVVASLLLVLMYFTREQAFIYIAGVILFYLLTRFEFKRAILYFLVISVSCIVLDRFVLIHLVGKYFLYSVTGSGVNVSSQYLPGVAVSDALRGGSVKVGSLIVIGKKVFYNLYNFYKLIPQIMSPYLFTLFVIGLFIGHPPSHKATEGRVELEVSFKIAMVFMVLVTLLVVAASIPFFRYIHPVVPLVYIISIGTLVEIIRLWNVDYGLLSKTKNPAISNLISIILVVFFAVGPILGVLLLDSRFERNTHNVGKPPVYVVLSQIMKANTSSNQVVITNLDTWGSWYGERKTVWFPLEPKQIIDPATGKIPFDAIYLTSYLIDDQNYYMGADWRLIFNNPKDSAKWICNGCTEISKEFVLKGIYSIPASDNYDRLDATGILLIKK